MKSGNILYANLLQLIDITKQQQLLADKTHMSPLAYSKEYCTVGLKVARGSGHTYAIAKLVISEFPNAIVLSNNKRLSGLVKSEIDKIDPNIVIEDWRFSSTNCLSSLRGAKDVGCIIVDCASFLSKNEIDSIYDNFCCYSFTNKNFFFIFIE